MKKYIFISLIIFNGVQGIAQDKSLPYYQIPSYPETYTAANVAARMVDGVGFRYYCQHELSA